MKTKIKVLAVGFGLFAWTAGAEPVAPKEGVDCIDPFIGTVTYPDAAYIKRNGGHGGHGCGKTFPGAATPFGQVQLSPDTVTGGDNGPGYSYPMNTIEGFSFLHMSGIGWYGEFGNLQVMPTTGKLEFDRDAAKSSFNHANESAKAGFYRVSLERYNIAAELTASRTCGLLRFTYPANETAHLKFDLGRRIGQRGRWLSHSEQHLTVVNDRVLEGYMKCNSADGGWGRGAGQVNYTVYFHAELSEPLVAWDFADRGTRVAGEKLKQYTGGNVVFVGTFGKLAHPVVMKTGISFDSIADARANYRREIATASFDEVKASARAAWKNAIDGIHVKGGTERERTIFATSLYHAFLDPREIGKGKGFTRRTVFSGWDVFRSEMPLLTLLRPDVVSDTISSMMETVTTGKRRTLPRWDIFGCDSGCMIGQPIISVMADAYEKGIRDFDVKLALRLADESLAAESASRKYGFAPGSLSSSLEYAYFDWCYGRLAELAGDAKAAARGFAYAQNYTNSWCREVGWMRTRQSNGAWLPWKGRHVHGQGCVESNPWQQGWFVPHDVEGLVRLMGGREKFTAELETFFAETPQHFGWCNSYNHPNEPCHTLPFLFAHSAKPQLTSFWTRAICARAYDMGPYGLCGNDDVGQMSAWYVLASIGLHPLCPGDGRWYLCAPIFKETTIRLDPKYYRGGTFTIRAPNADAEHATIKCVKLNGKVLDRWYITTAEVTAGGVLEFDLAKDSSEAETNLAFRRAVYQSSAADVNRVGHLVTDGLRTGREVRPSRFSSLDETKSPSNERPVQAFDGNKGTKWLHFGAQAWLQVELSQAKKPTAYALTSANDMEERDPKDWVLQGSDDGKTFVDLDAQTNQNFPSRFATRTFPLALTRAYRFYRLSVTANHGCSEPEKGAIIQLAEFDLLDAEGRSLARAGAPESFVSAWVSRGAQNEWIFVDLGAASEISRVRLDWCAAEFATVYEVQVSDDAKSWRTVATVTNGAGGTEEVPFAKTKARYVRLFCRTSSAGRFALAELEVMGTNGLKPYTTGTNWRVQRASEVKANGEALTAGAFDDSAWLPAVVPGTVLTSYLRAGAIPDMNIADNQTMISDSFFTADFWYRKTFTVKAPAKGGRVWLNFEAINWKAEVFLNGQKLGRIDGAFLRKSFDITQVANFVGENRLAVLIHKNDYPGAVTLQDLKSPGLNGGILGRDNPTIHASIGWDWVPTVRGRNIGIYRDVTVTYSGDVTLANGWAVTELDVKKKDFSKAEVTLRAQVRNAADHPVTTVVTGTVEPGGYTVKSAPITLAAGTTSEVAVGTFTMAKPRLWWPATYGGQPLYTAKLTADVEGQTSQVHSFKFGVRKFTYKTGKPMTIFCNGTRIVCRGGNWGMDDANLAATPLDYDTKVRLHAEANLNMIRNWVGMTNSEDFYRACDKYGVLVWDDFWLANPSDGPNPDDPEMFLANATDKVLKVRHHAALALYCGRNEGNPPKSLYDALPKLVARLDGTRHYIPDSAANTVSGHGPYGVRNPEWYFKNAPATLHSERGLPNVPEIDSMRRMLGPDHLWPIDNVWGQHDFTYGGAQNCKGFSDYIRSSYQAPQSLEEFTRLAQLVAYENYKTLFESVYVKGGNGMLLWMSQSAWPSMVWQTYDYWHDVNGGYFGSKAGNQPINVILDQSTMKLWAVNATPRRFCGRVLISVNDTEGNPYPSQIPWEELDLASDARVEVGTLPDYKTKDGIVILCVRVWDDNQAGRSIVAENNMWINQREPRNYKALLPLLAGEATIRDVRVTRTGSRAKGTVSVKNNTGKPLLFVRLKLVDANGTRVLPVHWSDNYLSFLTGMGERTVTFEATDCSAAVGELKVVQEKVAFSDPTKLPDWAFGPFKRPEGVNPVIRPQPTSFDCPMRKRPIKWEESDTFNPAAAIKDGKIVVLYRAEDNTAQGIGSRTSRLGYAETTDGVTFTRAPKPVLFPCEDDQKAFDWEGGCEDPRVAQTEDGLYVCMYTSWNRKVPRLCVATSRDLKTWTKHGPAFAKFGGAGFRNRGCKSGAIVQAPSAKDPSRYVITKINGKYVMYWGEAALEIAYSDNLLDWVPAGPVMRTRKGYFDSALTEMGPAAILTKKGIVVLYNGKNSNGSTADPNYPRGVYSGGQALFSATEPTKLLARLDRPYFKPEAPFEKTGQYKDGTVFTEGLVFYKGAWHLYYGCADSFVGTAVWKVED